MAQTFEDLLMKFECQLDVYGELHEVVESIEARGLKGHALQEAFMAFVAEHPEIVGANYVIGAIDALAYDEEETLRADGWAWMPSKRELHQAQYNLWLARQGRPAAFHVGPAPRGLRF